MTELRKEISNNIKDYNYNKDILDALNYQNSAQLSKDVNKIDTFIGYESIVPFCIKYNIICKIYLEDDMYKGNKWIGIEQLQS